MFAQLWLLISRYSWSNRDKIQTLGSSVEVKPVWPALWQQIASSEITNRLRSQRVALCNTQGSSYAKGQKIITQVAILRQYTTLQARHIAESWTRSCFTVESFISKTKVCFGISEAPDQTDQSLLVTNRNCVCCCQTCCPRSLMRIDTLGVSPWRRQVHIPLGKVCHFA